MADLGVWTVDGDAPKRVSRSGVGLERNLEDWIANDSSLLADGLTIVGRQVRLDGGPLDLLAIDWQDRWVVIELKAGRLYRDALAQALDYASSVSAMDGAGLVELLEPGLDKLGDPDELSPRVRRQVAGEEEGREVAVLLAGIGVEAGLERVVAHLGGYGIPITVVSFDAFEPQEGLRVLIREVTEEQTEGPAPRPRRTVALIRDHASEAGVSDQLDRFIEMSEDASLAVQPQKHSIRIAPPANRTRYLMYARPEDGGMWVSASPKSFAEFFPLTEEKVEAAIGSDEGRHLAGAELDERLIQIAEFLKELPHPDDEDGDS